VLESPIPKTRTSERRVVSDYKNRRYIYDEPRKLTTDDKVYYNFMNPDSALLFLTPHPLNDEDVLYNSFTSNYWQVVRLRAIDHPNVVTELEGKKPLIPGAVRLSQVQQAIKEHCSPVTRQTSTIFDFEFPKGSGKWYRPDEVFERRYLARWSRPWEAEIYSIDVQGYCPRRNMHFDDARWSA
jgi:hypothetical protein